MRRKLMKGWYSTIEYVDSLRGVHRTLLINSGQQRPQKKRRFYQRIVLKWPLNQSFTGYYEVRIFRNVFLSAYFNLIWTRTKICLTRNFKVHRRRSNICIFLRTLKRARVALIHLPKEIFTGI